MARGGVGWASWLLFLVGHSPSWFSRLGHMSLLGRGPEAGFRSMGWSGSWYLLGWRVQVVLPSLRWCQLRF
ncbi:uncharacterized protein EI90DRAFT_3037363 [Cantharellus anzutake]|uniref:uncharacterized protein n=1 Tax=Cantharellus anzutake TaxID=1750568 RepID=UPI0019050753|nr:uncharacterized protein EI90DRAFT_3037363 [Cantharellus anzutake]KAF8339650.1 hypothetical protein EI90DRAFT_3037363 [Cantharellus anzutake]